MKLRSFVLYAAWTLPMAAAQPSGDACGESPCQGGCYDSDMNGSCEPTPTGHYSPPNDDAMYPCPPGSHAERPRSAACALCEAGSYVEWAGSPGCFFCPPGQYSNTSGAASCMGCQPYFYYGPGAYDVFVDGTDLYCLKPLTDQTSVPSLSVAPSTTPTSVPSSRPTPSPSHLPSHGPTRVPSSVRPTRVASQVPSSTPSRQWMAPPKTTPTAPSIAPNSGTAPSPDRHQARNEAFWRYLPLLGVALIIVLFALVVQRYRPKKTKRPPRPIPLPPTDSHGTIASTPVTEADGQAPDDGSLEDVYIEDETSRGDSLVSKTASV